MEQPLRPPFPRISVLTASFNSAGQLPGLMASLRAQTDRDFEWIVMDGGSTDGTQELLRQAGDLVTHWRSEPDFGIYHALNKALALAGGSHYLVLGSDDTLYPDAIANFRTAAQASGADIVSAPIRAGEALIRPRVRAAWWSSSPPYVSSHSVGALMRTALHQELGLYSNRFPIAADTYFFLKAWKAGKRFHYFETPVGAYGIGGTSSNDILGGMCESFRANAEVRGHLPLHLFLLVLRILKNGPRIAAALAARRSRLPSAAGQGKA